MLPFAWASDIHLDHARADAVAVFKAELAKTPHRLILLTGDLSNAKRFQNDLRGLQTAGKHVVFVLGNHDYWGGSIAGAKLLAKQEFGAGGVTYLSGSTVTTPDGGVLMGVDGYSDGRAGDLMKSKVWLNDYILCRDFAGCGATDRPFRLRKILNDLGDKSAEEFNQQIDLMVGLGNPVYVATHAPPFREAHFAPGGAPGDDDWAPHFVNVALGEAIKAAAIKYPDTKFVVLAGHTHTGCRVEVTPNLTCLVADAAYGWPALQSPDDLPRRSVT